MSLLTTFTRERKSQEPVPVRLAIGYGEIYIIRFVIVSWLDWGMSAEVVM
jgi:hypothetical protein